ncbi:MAG: glycosyltransferase family 4 protein [Nitrospirae bacterium YQR-1]
MIFYVSAAISALFAFLIWKHGFRLSLVDIPNVRSSHASPTPRGGGVGIAVALLVSGLITVDNYWVVLVVFAMGVLGFLEDIFSLSTLLRLIVQLTLSIFMVYLTLGIPHTPVEILLLIFWCIFLTATANFYNFMDGINGIAGVTGVVGFLFMAIIAFLGVKAYEVGFLAVILCGACAGFLPFNFPKGRVFMGDVGSLLLGFAFAAMVMKMSTSPGTFICLSMLLCTFYADSVVTIYYRLRLGENLTKAHRRHLYQYLSNEQGIPQWKVTTLYALVQFIAGIVALSLLKGQLRWQAGYLLVFFLIFLMAYYGIKKGHHGKK